jgi:putative DNA primase/helicase
LALLLDREVANRNTKRFHTRMRAARLRHTQAAVEDVDYALTTDTRQQKIFLLVGPPRSGKGTIIRVLKALCNSSNVVNPAFSSLAENFGLQPLIGKTLAIIADARLGPRTDASKVVELLLGISGEDDQTISRKFLPAWTGKLLAKFIVVSNELPALPDASGAISSRMVIFRLVKSFLGQENPNLTKELLSELPGVLNWAIDGLRRLIARGHFRQPTASGELVAAMEAAASPIRTFLQDSCDLDPNRWVETGELYAAWCTWCDVHRYTQPGTSHNFARQLHAAHPAMTTRQKRAEGGWRRRYYVGLALQEQSASRSVTRDLTLHSVVQTSP